ncbi:MAG: OsmC family protein [Pseudomonadota bacterium]
MPEPTAFEIETAKKTKEGLDLEVHVLCELVPGPGLVKRGYVKPNIPSFGAFELYCDEGAMIGGSDSAPAPLSYLAAGVAFCFLTHLKGYADNEKLQVSSIRIEQRMKFQSRIPGMTAEMGGQMEGHSKGVETFVLIETDEPPEVIALMVEAAEKACMAAQTVISAVPTSTRVISNGERI